MNEPLSIDMKVLEDSLRAVKRKLKITEERLRFAIYAALVEYAEKFLEKAQARAPHDKGNLRGSATVVAEALEQEKQVSVTAGFNIVYAHIRDAGGTIRPVRAKALFIPLRPGVRPGEPGLEMGKDFWLAQEVTQKGNGYFTRTAAEAKDELAKFVAERVASAFLRPPPPPRKGGGPKKG